MSLYNLALEYHDLFTAEFLFSLALDTNLINWKKLVKNPH